MVYPYTPSCPLYATRSSRPDHSRTEGLHQRVGHKARWGKSVHSLNMWARAEVDSAWERIVNSDLISLETIHSTESLVRVE